MRTTKQANERMLALHAAGREASNGWRSCTPARRTRAREFLNRLMMEMNQSLPRDILMVNVTTVIGTHVGPNGLGFAAVRA